MGASTLGPAAMIIDCPDVRFLPHLVAHSAFTAWQQAAPASPASPAASTPAPSRQATVIVHLAPAEVASRVNTPISISVRICKLLT